MSKTIKKVESIAYKAMPVVAGFAIVGLTIRYFGDYPIIEDIKKGLTGDVKGVLFG